jgi:hypothetical protein
MSEDAMAMVPSDATGSAVVDTGAPADPLCRRPATICLLTAWLLPATTAGRTAHVGLARAYGVHILSAVLTTVLVFVLVCWEDTLGRDRGIWHTMDRGLSGILHDIRRWPGEAALIFAGTVASIEVGFLILGVLFMPWGARDERVRASLAHALRQVWLHTTHALPLVLLIGTMMLQMERARREWWQRNRGPGLSHGAIAAESACQCQGVGRRSGRPDGLPSHCAEVLRGLGGASASPAVLREA